MAGIELSTDPKSTLNKLSNTKKIMTLSPVLFFWKNIKFTHAKIALLRNRQKKFETNFKYVPVGSYIDDDWFCISRCFSLELSHGFCNVTSRSWKNSLWKEQLAHMTEINKKNFFGFFFNILYSEPLYIVEHYLNLHFRIVLNHMINEISLF